MIASLRRTALALALCTGATVWVFAALAPAAAQAESGSCPPARSSQPFANWLDWSSYMLVPGGDFESPSWTLDGGAAIVSGSEPFAATGALGASSLSLPAGASAQSPATCVNVGDPTLRFFVAGSGKVMVRVVYNGSAIPVGVIGAGGSWAPSTVLPTGSALFAALWGTQAAVRFTGLSGAPQIDDVFIDPWNRH